MKALNNMYKAVFTSLLFVVFSFIANAQDYTVDFSDTSTYDVTCGKVVPAQWSVKNDSCLLYTPYFRVDAETGSDVNFSFRINQSGNGDVTDRGYVFHAIDDGEWILDSAWTAGGSPAVYTLEDGLEGLAFGHYIRFMVALRTDSKTEFWAIKSGEIEITDGDGLPSQQLISIWYGRPPVPPLTDPFDLPVELLSFSGKVDNGAVVLKWATASEINNDFFTIEKSEDGVFFEVIGAIAGAGNTNSRMDYSFTDDNPYELAYYRLKQTDYNGAFTYSSIIKVSEELCGTNEIEIASSNGSVNVLVNSTASGKLTISIYTLSGTLIFNSDNQIESGCSTIKVSPDVTRNSIYLVSASLNAQTPFSSKVYIN
jgi:hypothetical protein